MCEHLDQLQLLGRGHKGDRVALGLLRGSGGVCHGKVGISGSRREAGWSALVMGLSLGSELESRGEGSRSD